jgi:hypothetical protein
LGAGSYLCQIQTRFGGGVESLAKADHATLRTINIDQTYRLGGYLTIQADFVYLEVSLKSSSVLYQFESFGSIFLRWFIGVGVDGRAVSLKI